MKGYIKDKVMIKLYLTPEELCYICNKVTGFYDYNPDLLKDFEKKALKEEIQAVAEAMPEAQIGYWKKV